MGPVADLVFFGGGVGALKTRKNEKRVYLGAAMSVRSYTGRKRVRKSFGRIPTVVPMPNLIEVQKKSYESFLQGNVARPDREEA